MMVFGPDWDYILCVSMCETVGKVHRSRGGWIQGVTVGSGVHFQCCFHMSVEVAVCFSGTCLVLTVVFNLNFDFG